MIIIIFMFPIQMATRQITMMYPHNDTVIIIISENNQNPTHP